MVCRGIMIRLLTANTLLPRSERLPLLLPQPVLQLPYPLSRAISRPSWTNTAQQWRQKGTETSDARNHVVTRVTCSRVSPTTRKVERYRGGATGNSTISGKTTVASTITRKTLTRSVPTPTGNQESTVIGTKIWSTSLKQNTKNAWRPH